MPTLSPTTSSFFARASLSIADLRGQAEQLQAQISTGQRLSKSSDDPLSASRLRNLARTTTLSAIDARTADRASADLGLADNALSTFATSIQRAQELATQAATATLNPAQRAAIGTELGQIHSNLVALANSRDSAGHALFGGETSGDAYTLDAAGQASYAGTASSGTLALGDGQTITRGLTGPEFLNFSSGGSTTDILKVVKDLSDALKGGVADPAAAAKATLTPLGQGLEAVTTGQTVVGARLASIELAAGQRLSASDTRANEQTVLGTTDTASSIAQLQQTMLVLEASQQSFAKLSGLTLFSHLT